MFGSGTVANRDLVIRFAFNKSQIHEVLSAVSNANQSGSQDGKQTRARNRFQMDGATLAHVPG
jgi:hypothetical protein